MPRPACLTPSVAGPLRVPVSAALGALLTRTAAIALRRRPPGGSDRWTRTNYGGRTVSILGGAAVAAGATAASSVAGAASLAGFLAGGAGAAFGALDDLTERMEGRSKGFRGHLGALARGRLTTGGAKLLGISAASLVAASSATRGGRGHSVPGRAMDVLASAALIAGTANLVNLLDLRPGRALKGVVILTTPVALGGGPAGALAAGTCGAALAALPGDLAEKTMLGDTGANSLGALAGTALALSPSPRVRVALLVGIVGLTAASERFSFSQVIDRTPVLRSIDSWGRAYR